jgi:hypothetical protein
MKKYTIPLLTALIISAGYLCLESHESQSTEQMEFVIEKPYLNVVKGLATKNSLEKMVEESDGLVTRKHWEFLNVEVPDRILRLKAYKIEGLLKFVVEKKDHDLGDLKLPFAQKMNLDSHMLTIETRLEETQASILTYEKKVEISPVIEDNRITPSTHVAVKSELKVRKTIPFFLKKHMDGKVAETNKKDLKRLKENISVMAEQKSVVTFSRDRSK